ncbi:hypothetical protein X949_4263 [Burkholderia pseudomallei MSHR5609]|nr:hypothetical protein X949_4263 [Burkholderia pseudomallei MSHR5609]
MVIFAENIAKPIQFIQHAIFADRFVCAGCDRIRHESFSSRNDRHRPRDTLATFDQRGQHVHLGPALRCMLVSVHIFARGLRSVEMGAFPRALGVLFELRELLNQVLRIAPCGQRSFHFGRDLTAALKHRCSQCRFGFFVSPLIFGRLRWQLACVVDRFCVPFPRPVRIGNARAFESRACILERAGSRLESFVKLLHESSCLLMVGRDAPLTWPTSS